ncbi:MAG: alpha/beta hydrolase [Erythrobacter sp.]|nr:alpha/beta hydrolase [Erythrobacter sp.]
MLRKFTLAALALLAAPAAAQMPTWSTQEEPAPAQPDAIVLSVPADTANEEYWFHQGNPLGPAWQVRNVTVPTLVAYPAQGENAGAAMIVAPGGGFLGLAIEREGWDVARFLSEHGITAFVLKYRMVPTPVDQPTFAAEMASMRAGGPGRFRPPSDTPPQSLEDGLAALRYVRQHAADYGVDPHRVGFMGFSAGGFLTRSVIEHGGDDAPDFAAPIYPNMAAMDVPANAPPMFVTIAADDFLLAPHQGFPLVDSYRAAGRPIEFHLLPSGGHGFGMGYPGTPTEGWAEVMLQWMRNSGVLEDRD